MEELNNAAEAPLLGPRGSKGAQPSSCSPKNGLIGCALVSAMILVLLISRTSSAKTLTYTNPLINSDTPDPGCFFSASQNTYFCAHTCNGYGALCLNPDGNFPIYASSDLSSWSYSGVALSTTKDSGGAWAIDR